MRAAILRDPETHDVAVTEVPVPEPAEGEVRVRVLRCGICGSDVHLVYHKWSAPPFVPIIIGHEAVGLVDALGPGVEGPARGSRVSIVPLLTCGACRACRAGRTVICSQRRILGNHVHGAMAEWLVVPARNLVPVPEAVPHELAAIATDAVATAFHALRRGGVGPGRRVAIFGAGGLGLAAVGCARTLGAEHIVAVDPRPSARAWALETGADEAVHPDEAVEHLRAGGGVDASFEFVGARDVAEAAVRVLAPGGRAVVVGADTARFSAGNMLPFVLYEREVIGSYGSEPSELAEVLALLARGDLKLPRAIGEVVGLDGVADAIRRLRDGDTPGARIVVDPAR